MKHEVQLILDRGADVNARHGKRGNALQVAAYFCQVGAVRDHALLRVSSRTWCSAVYGNALQAVRGERPQFSMSGPDCT